MNLTGIVNENLGYKSTPKDFTDRGFIERDDGLGDAVWSIDWRFENDHFCVVIDPCRVVSLYHRNPDSDGIKVIVNDLMELDELLSWIADA